MVNRIRDDNIGYTLTAMAMLYTKSGENAQELRAFQDAWCILQEEVAEDDFTVAMCLRNIGSLYANEENFPEALDYFERSLSITQKPVHPGYPTLGEIHTGLAKVHSKLGHHDLALKHFNAGVKIKKKSYRQPRTVADTLINFADVYKKESKLKEALSFNEQAAISYHQKLPPTHDDVTEVEGNIQEVLSRLS